MTIQDNQSPRNYDKIPFCADQSQPLTIQDLT